MNAGDGRVGGGRSTLDGRVAFVTGGSQGIGREIAGALADSGAMVVAASRRAPDFRSPGGRLVRGRPLDVTDRAAGRDAVAQVRAEHGRLDILVHSAGVAESTKFLDLTEDDWRRHLAVDVDSVVWLTQAALPGMVEQDYGRVISIGSVASHVGVPYVAAYVAAKHALLGLTRALAIEFARTGVTFNCVSPYYVRTPMAEAAIATIVEKTGRSRESAAAHLHTPQGRIVQPDEVAAMCVHLCGDAARSITGQSIRIDGGRVHA
jgi:NAD(P)-dependent dehydrogenase (short-subunit alcohol dehydrogenase family)